MTTCFWNTRSSRKIISAKPCAIRTTRAFLSNWSKTSTVRNLDQKEGCTIRILTYLLILNPALVGSWTNPSSRWSQKWTQKRWARSLPLLRRPKCSERSCCCYATGQTWCSPSSSITWFTKSKQCSHPAWEVLSSQIFHPIRVKKKAKSMSSC